MSSSDTEDELPPLNKDITSPSHNAANLQTVKKKSQRTINNPQAGPRTSNENPRPRNIWQQIRDIQRPLSNIIEPVSSTPRVSPITVQDETDSPTINRNPTYPEEYMTTPLAESAGAALVSKQDVLPVISGVMTNESLIEAIDGLAILVSKLAVTFGDTPENLKAANTHYKDLIARLNQARLIAASRSLDEAQSKCNEIGTELESYKLKWSIHSNNTSKTSSSFFHGFNSIDFHKAAANLPTGQNHAKTLKDLTKRIKAMEAIANSFKARTPQLQDQIQVNSGNGPSLDERVSSLELKLQAPTSSEEKIRALSSRFESMEIEIRRLNNLIVKQAESCDKSAECQRTLAKEYASFQLSYRNDIDDLHSILEGFQSNLETFLQEEIPKSPLQAKLPNYTSAKEPAAQIAGNLKSNYVREWIHNQQPSMENQSKNQQPEIQGHASTYSKSVKNKNNIDEERYEVNSNISSLSTLDVYGRSLRRQKLALEKLFNPEPGKNTDKATLNDLYRNRLPIIEAEKRDLQQSLRDYLKMQNANIQLCEDVEDTLDSADQWTNNLREIYLQNGHHKRSQTNKLHESLSKFSPKSEIDIFEFIRRFENITTEFEIAEEKAELFYTKYISPSLQDELVKVKEDYNAMKNLLMLRYGDLDTITSNILSNIIREKKPPNDADLGSKLSYYRKLQSALEKIDQIVKIPNVSIKEVEDYIYGHQFLKQLSPLLPDPVLDSFIDTMRDLGQNITKINGKIAFKTMLSCTNLAYEKVDSISRNTDFFNNQNPKRDKPERRNHTNAKQVNHANHDADISSASDDERPANEVLHQKKEQSEPKEKPVCSRKFPCILSDHKHSISECIEFFMITPQDRVARRKEFAYKYCTLCLQSNKDCKYKKCINYKNIPPVLKCKDCVSAAKNKTRPRPAYSIFFCINEKHSKPANNDVLKALEDFVPGFISSNLNTPVNMSCHLQILAATSKKSAPPSLSRPVQDDIPAPVFNTSTGCEENPGTEDMIKEVNEDSIGVMQILNIGGKATLTLYDRGANQNLISGELAEDLGIKVLTQEQGTIGVVSGTRIWTGYGTYELYLGPTIEGKYYQLVCQGMKSITSVFPKYYLNEISKEATECFNLHPQTAFPEYIGGDSIKLLVGLKNAELEPVCVMNLPSGIGLYRSVFKDVFGSVYCFGGPHRIFSDVHKKFGGSVNYIYSYFTEIINQYRGSPYAALKSIFDPDLTDTGHGISHYKDDCLSVDDIASNIENLHPVGLMEENIADLDMITNDTSAPSHFDCPAAHCVCPATSIALKAKIPLSKQKIYLDEEDKDDVVNFRCEKCLRCKCASSSSSRMKSLTEQNEQIAIEKSVTIDLENKQVLVDLPFTSPPDKFLSDRHSSNSNYNQALKVYKSQCRLNENKKDHIRTVIKDLKDKNFLKNLSDLPKEHTDLIQNSSFKHYMPWRTVSKDSASTPLRIVVDPSMSGLNLILAKGENRMNRLIDVLLRARIKPYIWSSDISKLYNCLKLQPTSYAYQLFLFDESLDINTPPQILVMCVAWYGVSSSSNQAIFAIEELSRLHSESHPLAFRILNDCIYVDDIFSGGDSKFDCKQQISEVEYVLNSGGLKLKFVIVSGEMIDGSDSLKVLGYNWNTVDDKLSPGFTELNFNKKHRGLKSPNPFPVVTSDDVDKLLQGFEITRRVVVSKIAEYWEPVGIWEPSRVQLKLSAQLLNGLNWDTPLDPESQKYWQDKFKDFLDIPKLEVNRYVLPRASKPGSKLRLLCLSDAATNMGGAAIYIGHQMPDGYFSCQLLTSRSKIMAHTIPRNELESLRLSAILAQEVKDALRDAVGEILFFTDSQIAVSWCQNTDKKLRLFVLNRVSEIRRIVSSLSGRSDNLPIYHIDGKNNIADLLTKFNNLKPADLHSESCWINGMTWMKYKLEDMPIMSFSDIKLSAQQNQLLQEECFPEVIFPNKAVLQTSSSEPHCTGCLFTSGTGTQQICYGTSFESPHCLECSCPNKVSFAAQPGKGSLSLVDVIHFGLMKTKNILSFVHDFIWSLKHKMHIRKKIDILNSCPKCKAIEVSAGVLTEYKKTLQAESFNYLLRLETERLQKSSPKSKLDSFVLKEGILYVHGRLPEETEISTKDLDFKVFFDNMDIKGVLPVVSANSDIFYAILMHIHHKVRKHAGNEITLREIAKIVFPIHNARRIIQIVRKNCPRCRLLIRKTLELSMGNHPDARLTVTPCFYNCMMDICYGFPGKPHNNSRISIKIYALVICCLFTSATSILALESLETQHIVMALERHSSRHGVPATIFVDCGTQLIGLQSAQMNLRDANHQLRESIGLEIIPSTAKSHVERGRVERKIRTLREMLVKTATNTDVSMTALQWETVFAKMSSEIDDLPIARPDGSSNDDAGWGLLTPNRFKLGKANNRAIEGPLLISPSTGPSQLLNKIKDIQTYWYQLLLDRLHVLIPSPPKWNKTDLLNKGDIVVLRLKDNPNSKMEKWVVGKVTDIQKEGRKILCSYPTYVSGKDNVKWSTVFRSPRDLCIISRESEIPLNSQEFFNRVKIIS